MSVAVKTSPGARSSGLRASSAILSLVGVVYLLACLAIVFKLIPALWWEAWDGLGLGSYTFVGGALLAVVGLVSAVVLLVVGARLLGPQPPAGVRAGVFVGFVGLLTVALLTRWASLWIEHWALGGRTFGDHPQTSGLIAVAAVAAVLLLGWVWLFFRPGTQNFVLRFEQAGWFHATPYKSNQGQKVRRGTVAGILLLVGAGIYTLVTHNALGRGSPNWVINLPFTGTVAVESYGDAQQFIAELPASAKSQVEVRWPGEGTGFRAGEKVSFDKYREAVESKLSGDDRLSGAPEEPTAYLLAVNKRVLAATMTRLLETNSYPEGVARRLEAKLDSTPWADVGDAIPDFFREAEAARRNNPDKVLPHEFAVPAAVLLIDRYALRNVNEKTDESQNVKVVLAGDSNFKEGDVVSREEFDKERERLQALIAKGRFRQLPERGPLVPATGPVEYASITLLPSVQFTLPLLLLAVSLWLAWRVVNMPAFADFLIATEAELNKVSWTTQKKLVQDTTVVLITVLLMAVFLFGMDWTWKVVLSWKPIGVLHIPKEQSQQNRTLEQKKW
jgi:preprotein translocase SecE subunit